MTYEEKIWLLNLVIDRAKKLKNQVKKERREVDKKCPHDRLVNTTTMADPDNVKKELCLDCGKELLYVDGILKN